MMPRKVTEPATIVLRHRKSNADIPEKALKDFLSLDKTSRIVTLGFPENKDPFNVNPVQASFLRAGYLVDFRIKSRNKEPEAVVEIDPDSPMGKNLASMLDEGYTMEYALAGLGETDKSGKTRFTEIAYVAVLQSTAQDGR